MNVAIIPARGGSQRIARKNIKPFLGKPIIAYAISAAQASGCFERIIVSTDDPEIAAIASYYGAEVPFIRPANISDDHASTMDVMTHCLAYLSAQHTHPDYVCCLYATAPFLRPEDIRHGFDMVHKQDVEFVFSATSFAFPIQRAITLNHDNRVTMLDQSHALTRSQDLPEAYHDAGQFYWGKTDAFIEQKAIFAAHSRALVLPRKRVQDIDTPEDWEFAEALYAVIHS